MSLYFGTQWYTFVCELRGHTLIEGATADNDFSDA